MVKGDSPGTRARVGARMKNLLFTTVSVLTLISVAQAADLAVKAPRPVLPVSANWTGWYGGLQGGIVDHRGKFHDIDGLLTGANGFGGQAYSPSHTGGIVGGHVGYNWQSNQWVYGFEADGSGVFAKFTALAPAPGNPDSNVSFDVSWLATFRARAGALISPDTLLYLTGGLAIGHVKNSASLVQSGFTLGTMTQESTRTGWVIGGGIEHMFSQRWTARAEVRYVDLGSSTVICPAPVCSVGPYRGEFSNKLLMGLVGASLKF
jgi:outer membrane immunogenic protein